MSEPAETENCGRCKFFEESVYPGKSKGWCNIRLPPQVVDEGLGRERRVWANESCDLFREKSQ